LLKHGGQVLLHEVVDAYGPCEVSSSGCAGLVGCEDVEDVVDPPFHVALSARAAEKLDERNGFTLGLDLYGSQGRGAVGSHGVDRAHNLMRLDGRTSERAGGSPVTVDGFFIDSQTLYVSRHTKPVRGIAPVGKSSVRRKRGSVIYIYVR